MVGVIHTRAPSEPFYTGEVMLYHSSGIFARRPGLEAEFGKRLESTLNLVREITQISDDDNTRSRLKRAISSIVTTRLVRVLIGFYVQSVRGRGEQSAKRTPHRFLQ